MKKLSFYYHMAMIHVIALLILVKIILKKGSLRVKKG